MPEKEITQLRKDGKIEESLLLAIQEYKAGSDLPWTKNNLVWPYYYVLKKYAEEEDCKNYIQRLKELIDLRLHDGNKRLNDNLHSLKLQGF